MTAKKNATIGGGAPDYLSAFDNLAGGVMLIQMFFDDAQIAGVGPPEKVKHIAH